MLARWASSKQPCGGVAGVQGGTAFSDPSVSAGSGRPAPVTPAVSEGVRRCNGKTLPAAFVTRRTLRGGACVTGNYPAKTLDFPHAGRAVTPRTHVTPLDSDQTDEFEERAAILEHDGGLSRAKAEAEAAHVPGLLPERP